MQQNPPCAISRCSSTVLFDLLVLKSGDSLKEQSDKTDKVNHVFFKKKSVPLKFQQKAQQPWYLARKYHKVLVCKKDSQITISQSNVFYCHVMLWLSCFANFCLSFADSVIFRSNRLEKVF